jgi:transketolase C-terminal domain/subunit
MIAAIRDNNPVIFVEHRLLYSTDAPVPKDPYIVDFGKARVVGEGSDITLVGISYMLVECLAARDLLSEVGISAEVIDPVSLMPLDIETISNSAKRTGTMLVVDNAWTTAGAGAEIVAAVCERGSPPIVGGWAMLLLLVRRVPRWKNFFIQMLLQLPLGPFQWFGPKKNFGSLMPTQSYPTK